MIAVLVRDGAILRGYDLVPDQVQPASLDLRLGEVAYRVRASFLPGPDTTVAQRIDELKLHEIALGDGAVLETGCVYIVPLIESLALPDDIAAAANPKSSTGRLDVFTRVIADETRGFDHVAAGYHGPLFAEISPRTLPVLVRAGSRLPQIRFRHGNALLDGDSLPALHARERLVDDSDADVREVPFILEHGQIVGRLVYENMLTRPRSLYGEGIGSNYQAQGLKLSKHFRT